MKNLSVICSRSEILIKLNANNETNKGLPLDGHLIQLVNYFWFIWASCLVTGWARITPINLHAPLLYVKDHCVKIKEALVK
jgi:hypothetical protein